MRDLLKDRRRLGLALAASLFVMSNWWLYIWVIAMGRITESALGYFITPLFSVALGALILRERLDVWTKLAVGIAGAGVLVASLLLGSPPWMAIAIGGTFAVYGFVKKRAGLDPLTGLAAETVVAAPFALVWLAGRHLAGAGALGGSDTVANVMLVLGGPVTAIPLLTFAYAANRITLQKLGFIQYISPASQFLLGVFVFGERLKPSLAVAFVSVILAVLVYAPTRLIAARGGRPSRP